MKRNQTKAIAALGSLGLALCLALSPAIAWADGTGGATGGDPAGQEQPTGQQDPAAPGAQEGEPQDPTGDKQDPTPDPGPQDGWNAGRTQYFKDGAAVTGVQAIDGKLWFFSPEGTLASTAGWTDAQDGRVLVNADGSLATGWVKQGGTWYYIDPADGTMATGLFSAKGVNYVARPDGSCPANAWVKVGTDWYRTGASCARVTGWVKLGGVWYYLDPADGGRMMTGPQTINGKNYFLNASGAMAVGWAKDGQSWRYASSSGALVTGWVKSSGTWYYLDPANGGIMVADCTLKINGKSYTFSSSGALLSGWVAKGSDWYYYDGSGQMVTGWVKPNGIWYYLDPASGKMVKGWQKIDGTWNAFNKQSGAWITDDPVCVSGCKTARSMGSATNWFIMVDDSRTKVYIYHWDGTEWYPERAWACTTGAPQSRTVHGVFSVGSRGYSFGHGYTCYYWTQFYQDYLFHSTKYVEGTMTHLDPWLNAHRSQGCVRLQIDNAKWIYNNIPSGTKVYVY